MSKKDNNLKKKQLQNSFQKPGVETPVDVDLSLKFIREQIVKKFLEEKENV